jgi:hypothetical protein
MILVQVMSLWNRCFDLGFPEISRSWPLSTTFFSCRHRKYDETRFDLILYMYPWTGSAEWAQNKRLAASISWNIRCTS